MSMQETSTARRGTLKLLSETNQDGSPLTETILVDEAQTRTIIAPPVVPSPSPQNEAVVAVILLALRVLGERSMLALYHLIPIGAVLTAFILWGRVLDSLTYEKLGALLIYSAFMLALIWITRKKE